MKVGIIGTGKIAGRHVEVLAGSCELLHLGTSEEKGAAAASASGGQYFASLDDLIGRGRPDAIIVTVPPHGHGAIEHRLIRDGIPFLVEKPLSADRRTAEQVAEALERRPVLAAVGYNWRALDTLPAVRHAVAVSPIGMVVGEYHVGMPPTAWWRKQASSGGQFVEQACHLVDLARVLMGEARVEAAIGSRPARHAYPDADVSSTSAALLRYGSGATGIFSATSLLARPADVRLCLMGEGTHIEVTAAAATISTRESVERIAVVENTYLRQDQAFLDAVMAGDPSGVFCTYADALVTHRLCQDISARLQASLEV